MGERKVIKEVTFYTGITTHSGSSPFDIVTNIIPVHILAELNKISFEMVKGVKGFGKVYELLITCIEGSDECKWMDKDPLFERTGT